MTYTLTTHHELDGWSIEADWSYTVSRYYPATRIDPPEYPGVEDLTLEAMRLEGKAVEPPEWLEERLRPSDNTLHEHAAGRAAYDRDEAADYQRNMRMDAA